MDWLAPLWAYLDRGMAWVRLSILRWSKDAPWLLWARYALEGPDSTAYAKDLLRLFCLFQKKLARYFLVLTTQKLILTFGQMIWYGIHFVFHHFIVQRLNVKRLNSERQIASQHCIHINSALIINRANYDSSFFERQEIQMKNKNLHAPHVHLWAVLFVCEKFGRFMISNKKY